MFNSNSRTEKTGLEEAIDRLHADMQTVDPYEDKYAVMADNLTKLYKLREHDRSTWHVSGDVVATISANLLGIAMIVGHERAHVITSKAVGFIRKLG